MKAAVLFILSVTGGLPALICDVPKSFDLRHSCHGGQNKIYMMYL